MARLCMWKYLPESAVDSFSFLRSKCTVVAWKLLNIWEYQPVSLIMCLVITPPFFFCRSCAEEAIRTLNGTQLGGTTVRLSWGRSPSSKQVIDWFPSILVASSCVARSMNPYVFVYFDWFFRRRIRVSIITVGMDKVRSIMDTPCRKILTHITEATLAGISSHHRWGSNHLSSHHSSNKSGSATSWRECS